MEMERKSVRLEQAGGKGPRQRMWEFIRKNRDGFSIEGVRASAKVSYGIAKRFITSLTNGGFLVIADEQYQLVKDAGVEAPRLSPEGEPIVYGSGVDAMWRAIRFLGEFNYRELAGYVNQAGVEITEGTARGYVLSLLDAGYLTVANKHSNKLTRYRMIPARYTGPRPPVVQNTKAVFDPNLNKVVWTKPIDERVLDEC